MTTRTCTTLLAAAFAATGCGQKDEASKAKPTPEAPKPVPEAPKPVPEAPTPTPTMIEVKDAGFATPESVLYLAEQDVYLVTNINGAPSAADDNGFISKLGPDGKLVELKWIDGSKPEVALDAPKGMAVQGGVLYVADITSVRMFDLATGAAKGSIPIKGTTFLNDVTAADGKVYVTDSGLTAELKPSGTDAIYAIDAAGAATKLASGADLKAPNGVAVVDGMVWIAPFGGKAIYQVVDGKVGDSIELPAGGLDGLEPIGDGRLVVSSWEGKAVYIGKPGAPFTALAEGIEAPADLGVDRKRKMVAVPLFMANAVRLYPVP